MKKNSFMLILLVFLFSCNKEKKDSVSCHFVSVEPALVGKWKLIRWSTSSYNKTSCETAGGFLYNTSDWGTNVVLEIRPESFRTYKNDTLVNESFSTNRTITSGVVREVYDVNCGNMYFTYRSYKPMMNSLHEVQIGDTLEINNPFVDINFVSYPTGIILSLTNRQFYVKVE